MLSKDIIVKIALELDINDIGKLCKTSKIFNKYICDNQFFWYNKIKRDYPEVLLEKGENYKELYRNISKNIEINIHISIHGYNEEGEEKEIFVDNSLKESITNIKERLNIILEIFFNSIPLFGHYDVKIDGEDICEYTISLTSCLDFINKETKDISITCYTEEEIEDDPYYQKILNRSMKI